MTPREPRGTADQAQVPQGTAADETVDDGAVLTDAAGDSTGDQALADAGLPAEGEFPDRTARREPGRSFRSAVPRAWVRARRTILSADAVSFLAAAILYLLAIGDVKGFAFTLGLSTVLDLVVVFLFTHPLMAVLSRVKSFGTNRFSGLGRVDHSRRPGPPAGTGRQLVGAASGSSTNGSNR